MEIRARSEYTRRAGGHTLSFWIPTLQFIYSRPSAFGLPMLDQSNLTFADRIREYSLFSIKGEHGFNVPSVELIRSFSQKTGLHSSTQIIAVKSLPRRNSMTWSFDPYYPPEEPRGHLEHSLYFDPQKMESAATFFSQ
jgi:hypothetical protein